MLESRLTFVRKSDKIDRHGKHYAWYKCSCDGKEVELRIYSVLRKNTYSCGCLKKELHKANFIKHNSTNSIEYRIWKGIKSRCYNKNTKSYKNYGGRGIVVCDRWKNSFTNFYNDMGIRPSSLHTIERINNDKDYSQDNCKWILKIEQNKNTRKNRFLTFNNKTQIVEDWAKELGVDSKILDARINRYKWSIEKTLTTPVRKFNNND